MKLAEKIIKLGLAIAAVAGIVFLVVKYIDAIKAWLEKLCPCCQIEEDIEEAAVEPVEEPVAEEIVEAPMVEEVVVEDGTPVAEENDFAE